LSLIAYSSAPIPLKAYINDTFSLKNIGGGTPAESQPSTPDQNTCLAFCFANRISKFIYIVHPFAFMKEGSHHGLNNYIDIKRIDL
jgi:hypothetical protein